MDVSEDRENIYITFKKSSGLAYLYKINLTDKTYEIYIPEDGYTVHPRPLDDATPDLRKIISAAIKNTAIYDIFVQNDIDPRFPMKISEVSPDSRKSSTPSLSSNESHSPNPDPLGNEFTRSRLKSALTFSRAIGKN